jgi:hypothetical protein
MPQPKRWLQRAELTMTVGAVVVVAIALVIGRLLGP